MPGSNQEDENWKAEKSRKFNRNCLLFDSNVEGEKYFQSTRINAIYSARNAILREARGRGKLFPARTSRPNRRRCCRENEILRRRPLLIPETFMGKTTGSLRNATQFPAFVMSVIVVGTTDSPLSSSRRLGFPSLHGTRGRLCVSKLFLETTMPLLSRYSIDRSRKKHTKIF